MKKVALIGPELYPIPPIRGGACELFIEKASQSMTRYRPAIFAPADPDLPIRESRNKVQYFRFKVSPVKKILYGWFKVYLADYEHQIARTLETLDPDIIHIHNRPLLVPFFRKRFAGKKIIFHMHNLYNYLGRFEKPQGDFEIEADLTLACSRFLLEAEKDRMVRGSKRQAVVYNGVDTEAFLPAWEKKTETAAMRRHYGLEDKRTVLYTGKIRESKGVMVLFSAMKEVFSKDPKSHLVLAGGTGFGYKRANKKTDFYNRLQREIAPFQDRVLQIPFTPPEDMPGIYLLGDVFAAPSQLEEALGMVFLEASSCGLPLIGTAQGGIPEILLDEKTGLLMKEKDNSKELAAKILFLLKNPEPARALGANGRRLMEEHFSWTRIAERLEDLYDSLDS
ncbi:MAG: glycosyltransferase family 4 protein [Pseudomonadota bacterium]